MPENIGDVNPAESSQTEPDVNTETTSTSEQVDSQVQDASTQEVKPEVTKPDRPEINYAMEAARKATEALEAVRQLQQQRQEPPPTQPQYSKAQLRAFAEQAVEPNQKVWALEEIDKLDKAERQAEIRQVFEGQQRKSQEEMVRSQSANFVAQNFPECFVKDQNGNNVGWNPGSPLAQRIGEYMRNPSLAQNPEGLIAAAKMAAFDLGVSMNKQLVGKINQTTAQLRKEQKKQLITGTGTMAQAEGSTAKIAKLAEEYRKTGSREVFKQLAKAKGIIPEL